MLRRFLGSLLAACMCAALLVAVAPVAAAAGDTRTRLGISDLRGWLVDEAHGHVLLSTGAGVSVVSLTGAPLTTLADLPAVTAFTLSPDGALLYVAVQGSDTVAVYDADTLARVTAYSLRCPTSLATAAGKIWVSSGCWSTGDAGQLASIDPGSGSLAVEPVAERWSGPPRLAAGAPSSTILLATDVTTTDGTQVVYGLDSGHPVKQAVRALACESAAVVSVAANGSAAAAACPNKAGVTTYRTSDGVVLDSYGPDAFGARSVAYSPDASFVATAFPAASYGSSGALQVFAIGSTGAPALTRTLGPDAGVTNDGVRFGRTGDLYTIVRNNAYDEVSSYDLLVVHQAARHPMALTVNQPATSLRGAELTVRGVLSSPTSTFGAGQSLTVTRTDLSGVTALPATMTANDGSYAFADTPTIGGPVTYAVSWSGDATHFPVLTRATVQVSRTVTSIAIAPNASSYAYGATAWVTAHLGATYTSRTVAIYATPYGQPKRLVRSAAVDSHGNMSATYVLTRRTVFSAQFAGDHRSAPAVASRAVVARGVLRVTLRDYYATSLGYYLVRQHIYPEVSARKLPATVGSCLRVRIQYRPAAVWNNSSLSYCFDTDGTGYAAALLGGSKPNGVPSRVRYEFAGDGATPPVASAWLYLKYRP